MLEWLKTILGEGYTEEIDKKVSAEIGKAFVSKIDYNAKNEAHKALEGQIAERDKQLEALKKVDAAGLQAEITKLQEMNANQMAAHAEEVKQLKITAAIESALAEAGARNKKAAGSLLDPQKIKLLEDGTVEGIDGQIELLKKSDDYLFQSAAPATMSGVKPAEAGGNPTAKKPEEMSYDELCAHLESNPNTNLI